jgi:hypothetical protein
MKQTIEFFARRCTADWLFPPCFVAVVLCVRLPLLFDDLRDLAAVLQAFIVP